MAVLNLPLLAGILVDMWISIISWFNGAFINYAWSIIILTILIKLIMTPLDFYNKKITRKNAKMQKVIQPQIEKLEKQYGNDRNLYNQKMNEVYKANNYNVIGSCLFMLINLVITFTIFISLLNGLNTMASNRISSQYQTLNEVYYTTYNENSSLVTQEEATELANNSVELKYDEIKDDWLWIKNVWKSDTATNSIPSFDEFLSITKQVVINGEVLNYETLDDTQKQQAQEEYELIMTPLRENIGGSNGYYILLILVVGTSVLSQWLIQRKMKVGDDSNNPAAGTSKVMMFVLPILLGVFALSSNSVFSLYLLTSQVISIMTTPIIDQIIDQVESNSEIKRINETTPEYSRKRVKDASNTPFSYDRDEKKNKKGRKQ